MSGIVYLIQPCELINTNRYKVGMSKLLNLNRMKAYKNGTRYLFICERKNVLETERSIIKAFNERYKKIAGREYFEINESEEEMIKYFISIVFPAKNEPENENTKSELWMSKYSYKNQN